MIKLIYSSLNYKPLSGESWSGLFVVNQRSEFKRSLTPITKQKYIITLWIVLFVMVSGCKGGDKSEISATDAIRIASSVAEKKKYDTESADIEVMKVKKHIERGSIRLVWLLMY